MQKAAAVEGKRQLRSTLWMKAALKSSGRREENLTFALIPLVRAKRLNIYIYIYTGWGEYTKTPSKKYNNKKD
jgi:hypothetical protein